MRSSILICAALIVTPALAHADEDDRPQTRMASPALLGTGIGVTALGASAMPWGILFAAVHSTPACPGPAGGCASSGPDPFNVAGWSIIGGASALIVGGITMIVFGARRVPITIADGPRGTAGMSLRVAF